jgi:guanyl-specific ribonuclease Sa
MGVDCRFTQRSKANACSDQKWRPFPYSRDGITFGNFEKQLPAQPRGYYHEYTVKTPGETTAAHAVSFQGNAASFITLTTITNPFGASRNRE